MLNIVMLVKNRPNLTLQALTSLVKNTDVEWNAVIVDDGSDNVTRAMLKTFSGLSNVALLRNESSKGITGQVRNLGIYWAEKYWGRGDYLYLSDNDVAFLPGWAVKMVKVYSDSYPSLFVLGGARHPYHQPIAIHGGWQEVDAVAGYSQLMDWNTWDQFGPLDAHAVGVCMGEDFQFSQKIRSYGARVGYMTEPVIADCGLTTTDGKPATGHSVKPRIEGLIQE